MQLEAIQQLLNNTTWIINYAKQDNKAQLIIFMAAGILVMQCDKPTMLSLLIDQSLGTL